MFTPIEIYSKVSEYIGKSLTLSELESWLVQMLPIYLLSPDSDAAKLAGTIELGLAEIQAGIKSERSLRNILSKYILENKIVYRYYPHQISVTETIASNLLQETKDLEWLDLSPSWSNVPQEVFV